MLVTLVYSKYFKRIRNVTFGFVLRWQDQKIRKMVASFLSKIINEGDLIFLFFYLISGSFLMNIFTLYTANFGSLIRTMTSYLTKKTSSNMVTMP